MGTQAAASFLGRQAGGAKAGKARVGTAVLESPWVFWGHWEQAGGLALHPGPASPPGSSDRLQLGNEGWSACGAASHGSLLGTVGHQLPSVRCPLGSSDKRLPGLSPAQPPPPGLREAVEKSQWPWAGPSLRNQVAGPAVTRATSDTSALLSERTPALCLCACVHTHMRYSSMCTHVQAAFPCPAQCHVHGGGSAHMCTRFSVVH